MKFTDVVALCTPPLQQAISKATELARRDQRKTVGWKTVFASLLISPDSNDITALMRQFGYGENEIRLIAVRLVEQERKTPEVPSNRAAQFGLGVEFERAVANMRLFAEIHNGASDGPIRSSHFLGGFFNSSSMTAAMRDTALAELSRDGATRRKLRNDYKDEFSGYPESRMKAGGDVRQNEDQREDQGDEEEQELTLDVLGVNLSEQAKLPTRRQYVGRDAEVAATFAILGQLARPSAILVGPDGCGRTSMFRAVANAIHDKRCPSSMQGVILIDFDTALLTSVSGQVGAMEGRAKQLVEYLKKYEKDKGERVILCIDDLQSTVGTGGMRGTGDLASLLRMYVSRGELQILATCAQDAYKELIESNTALARAYRKVPLAAPSTTATRTMLLSALERMQIDYGLTIYTEAVDTAVSLSSRYMRSVAQPTAAFDVLEQACSVVASASGTSKPSALIQAEERLQLVAMELTLKERESDTDNAIVVERLLARKKALEKTVRKLLNQTQRERNLLDVVKTARLKMFSASTGSAIERAVSELKTAREDLQKAQGDNPLLADCVNADIVSNVVGELTGVPISRMRASEISITLNLADTLRKRVLGQDHSMAAIAQQIQNSRAGFDDPRKPIGVFLLAGPSGVGKTETAHALAEAIYGGEDNVTVINMSEYQEAHTVSLLKGAPPGYVGYGRGGVLTEAVRRKPYSVVLLDEIEKAHRDIHELFYQVFDKGYMVDGSGVKVDFSNTVILLTSNVGSRTLSDQVLQHGKGLNIEELNEAIRPDLRRVFPAAFLGRLTTVPYLPLDDELLAGITKLQLGKISERVSAAHGVPLTYDDSIIAKVVSECNDTESGGRVVIRVLTTQIVPKLSRIVLERKQSGEPFRAFHVSLSKTGEVTLDVG